MLRSYMSDPFARRLLILLLLAVVVPIPIGLATDARGFVGNALGELAGAALAILLGLLVIDRFVEYRKQREWAKLRNYTLGAIAAHVCDTMSDLYVHFGGVAGHAFRVIMDGRNLPNTAAIEAFDTVLEELRELPDDAANDKSTSDVAVEFYDAVRWDLDQIQSVLTPWVMQSCPDRAVIDALIEFDHARRRLHNSITVHKQVVTHGVFPEVLSMVEASRDLYRALCASWETERGRSESFGEHEPT